MGTVPPEGAGEPLHAVVLIGELLFGSKVREALRQLGIEATFVTSPGSLDTTLSGPVALLIADLQEARLEPMDAIRRAKAKGAAVLAYGSHVDAGALEAGRQAGADTVVPRSVFSSQLPELIRGLVGRGR